MNTLGTIDKENGFPLYPELPEAGREEAQALIDKFKEQLKKAAHDAISDLYCDVAVFIESDSWGNFRNKLMDGFKNYSNRKLQADYDFKEIRRQIFKEFRADIIKDLNQDLVEENEKLKNDVARLEQWLRERNR